LTAAALFSSTDTAGCATDVFVFATKSKSYDSSGKASASSATVGKPAVQASQQNVRWSRAAICSICNDNAESRASARYGTRRATTRSINGTFDKEERAMAPGPRKRILHAVTDALAERDRLEIRAVDSLLALIAPLRRRRAGSRRRHRSSRRRSSSR